MALGGLIVARPPAEKEGIDHVFGLLREDLARLEHMVRVRGQNDAAKATSRKRSKRRRTSGST
jgi:hypothetical protein